MHLDLMKAFKDSFAVKVRIGKEFLPSYSLNNIAKIFLQDEKLDVGGEGYGGRLWKLFNEDRDKLIAYNIQDSKLMKKLDDKFMLIRNAAELARLSKIPIHRTLQVSFLVDYYVLRIAREQGYHFQSKRFGVKKATYPGGIVLTPEPALYTNICIYDFKSLYPNIIRTFNLSPDSILPKDYDGDCITTPNGIKFSKEQGIFPKILEDLTNLRYKYKDIQENLQNEGKKEEALIAEFQQTSVKVLILSMYGIMGSAFSRYFDIDVASSITLTGQHLTKSVADHLTSQGYKAIYGDTDSVMVDVNDLKNADKVQKLIIDFLDAEIPKFTGIKEHTLEMEHEKTLSKFIVLAKKEIYRKVYLERT